MRCSIVQYNLFIQRRQCSSLPRPLGTTRPPLRPPQATPATREPPTAPSTSSWRWGNWCIDSLNPEFRIDSILKGMRPRGGLRLPGARARAEDRRPPHEDLSAPTPAGTFRTHLPYVNSPCMKDSRFRKLFH